MVRMKCSSSVAWPGLGKVDIRYSSTRTDEVRAARTWAAMREFRRRQSCCRCDNARGNLDCFGAFQNGKRLVDYSCLQSNVRSSFPDRSPFLTPASVGCHNVVPKSEQD